MPAVLKCSSSSLFLKFQHDFPTCLSHFQLALSQVPSALHVQDGTLNLPQPGSSSCSHCRMWSLRQHKCSREKPILFPTLLPPSNSQQGAVDSNSKMSPELPTSLHVIDVILAGPSQQSFTPLLSRVPSSISSPLGSTGSWVLLLLGKLSRGFPILYLGFPGLGHLAPAASLPPHPQFQFCHFPFYCSVLPILTSFQFL